MLKKRTTLLLIAHGSRKNEANEEVQKLAYSLGKRLDRTVIACFLELTEPSIPQGVDLALQENPQEILALPYFLTQGRHLQEDIPRQLQEKARAYPEVKIKLLDYVGAQKGMVELLEKITQRKN